ncbi:chaplin family protein [Actinoplanes sp. NPDC049548]|uniref:chaplin family protein n=1 Tax=Actinoplanes sp. NPDC049548 TaxID=3155152 RepID=UPI0034288492
MKLVKGLVLGMGAVAAALVFTAGPASAAVSGGHDDVNVGVLNGNSVWVPVHIPVNVCGNAIAVLGIAGGAAHCSNH